MIKRIYINSTRFFLIVLLVFVSSVFPVWAATSEKKMVVVIDPGHGGKDPGAINKGVREKDVVLGVGLKLGQMIAENFPDVKIVYTRNTDVFIPLIDRSRIANKNKADLFISIHANICGTPSIRGTETYTLGLHRSNENLEVAKKENSVILLEDNYSQTYEGFDPNSSESYIMFELTQDIYMDQSLSFADDVQRQFQVKNVSLDRGVKQAGFLVLRQSSMPSVLIETGFLSNTQEAKYLNSEEGQRTIALSILEAFRKFKARNSSPLVAANESKKNHSETPSDGKSISKSDSSSRIKQESGNTTEAAVKAEETDSVVNEPKTPDSKENAALQESSTVSASAQSEVYYSVQIAASTTAVEPLPQNFKGLKNIRREKSDKYYRFYLGKESSVEKLEAILQQVKQKYPQAFVVSFADGKRIVVNP